MGSRNPSEDFPGSPVVKTLPSNGGGAGSNPGQGAKIPHAWRPKKQNIKQKQYCNKFNNDFKNGPHQKKKKERKGNPSEEEHMTTSEVNSKIYGYLEHVQI